MFSSSLFKAALSWLLAEVIATIFVLPICHLHFDCGCTWPGLGGYDHCDVMEAGPPDCPWCTRIEIFWSSAAVAALASWIAARALIDRRSFLLTTLIATLTNFLVLLLSGIVLSMLIGSPILAGL